MFHSHLFNLDFDRSISMFVDRITKNIIQEDLKNLGNYPFNVKSYSCCGRLECRGCHKLCPHTPRCSCPLHSAELHNNSLLSEGTLRPFSFPSPFLLLKPSLILDLYLSDVELYKFSLDNRVGKKTHG
jgi:hypothetical protein